MKRLLKLYAPAIVLSAMALGAWLQLNRYDDVMLLLLAGAVCCHVSAEMEK